MPPKNPLSEPAFMGMEILFRDAQHRAELAQVLRQQPGNAPFLVLDTCQRFEIYGLGVPEVPAELIGQRWTEADAVERLARIATGLFSRITGELEILGQVRTAYKAFVQAGGAGETWLDRIFQNALALARKARRQSGIDANLTSLGALASREMIESLPEHCPVALVGSGSLAGSMARYLSKRGRMPVRIASRCPENAARLALEIGGFGQGLDELEPLFHGVGGILCATAAPHPVIFRHHLDDTLRPLKIIDLGEPADCAPCVREAEFVSYKGLLDVEEQAQINSAERLSRARVAEAIIREGAHGALPGRSGN